MGIYSKDLYKGEESQENWRDVIGAEEYYRISDKGRLFSKRTNKFLKYQVNDNGYYTAFIFINGGYHKMKIARLVAMAFIPNYDKSKTQVDHIDTNRTNDCVENLRWMTPRENCVSNTITNERRKYCHHHPVAQYTKDGVFIKVHHNATFAALSIGRSSGGNISKCCRHNKNYRSAFGYKWEFAS